MRILFVSPEAVPFCKTGGLGDVAGALPPALADLGCQVSVMLPLYDAVPDWARRQMQFLRSINVPLSWRNQQADIYSMEYRGVTWYFIDNAYYFHRRELYGHYDDGERFAFFSKAVIDCIPALGLSVEVIHCNDWQTALIPVYLKCYYPNDSRYSGLRTLFTLHNIAYQGRFPRSFATDVAGIDDYYVYNGVLSYDDGINLVKAAILLVDGVTTVSPTYAREILLPEYGDGLDGILRDNRGKLSGIINGIDTESYNPEQDEYLTAAYSVENPAGKAENKLALQRMLELHESDDTPIVAIISRLAEHKGLDLVEAVLEELMTESLQLVVLGRGEWRYEQLFQQLKRRYPGKVSANILFSEDLAHKIYAGADMLLMPSRTEPCGLSQLIALRYGTLPIVRETGGLYDTVHAYNEYTDEGNGFSFAAYSPQNMLFTLRRACRLYRDHALWERLLIRGMGEDNSWGRSAQAYLARYRQVAGE